jgi:repressor of nif and glnA expression
MRGRFFRRAPAALLLEETEMTKTMVAILKVLEKHRDSVLGSREISRRLRVHGVELTERTVRYHLRIMDERGLTRVFGKEGRKITPKGLEELRDALVSDRVGFIISKIESLSFQMDFDPEAESGNVILNVSCFPERELGNALKIMRPVFASPYVMSDKVMAARGGEKIGDIMVPEGMVGLGTVCSVTVNGVFLKAGIPVVSRYGGLLQVEEDGPTRFVALISYEGSSLDPHQIFIKSTMTSVSDAVKGRSGTILASFREIPVASLKRAVELKEKLDSIGMGGILLIGGPNQPSLEVPVGMDRAGLTVVGGLNPVAAIEEAGVQTESAAMAIFTDYAELTPFKDAMKKLA